MSYYKYCRTKCTFKHYPLLCHKKLTLNENVTTIKNLNVLQ